MSINLQKNSTALLNAFNSVLDRSNKTNWALFTYEGKSNALKLDDTGEDGLEELAASFNSGKVEYAITTIDCPATSQPKIVLIHWQGDGVSTDRLASTASHVHEVKRFFRGVHLTVHARSEVDVEPAAILKEVHKVTASLTVRDTDRQGDNNADAPQAPVGSVYSRVMPKRDIDTTARDKFWSQMDKDEQARQVEESSRQRGINSQIEEDRKRLADVLHEKQEHSTAQYLEEQRQKRTSSDQARIDRISEAKEAIGGKGAELKSMWEKQGRPAAVQPSKPPPMIPIDRNGNNQQSNHSPPPPEHRSPPPPVHRHHEESEEVHEPPPLYYEPPEEDVVVQPPPSLSNGASPSPPVLQGVPTPPRATAGGAPAFASAMVPRHHSESDEEVANDDEWDDEGPAAVPKVIPTSQPIETIPNENDGADQAVPKPIPGKGLQAVALFDYQAADDTEISFDPAEVICHIEQIDPGWWKGEAPNGSVGLFPANYVQTLN